MKRVKARWEPYVFQARPSGIYGFSQKGAGAKRVDMATTQKLSICFLEL